MSEERNQVTRRLKIQDSTQRQRAAEIVRTIDGVETVESEGVELSISYDFSQLTWSQVCEELKSAALYTPSGTFARWRDSWREFQDQNMRENLTHRAACCSKPPPGAGRH